MAIGPNGSSWHDLLAHAIANYPAILGRKALVLRLPAPQGGDDAWEAIRVLRATMSDRDAFRVVLEPSQTSASSLAALLEVDEPAAVLYAERAARAILRQSPYDAKAEILRRLFGPDRGRVLSHVAAIAPTLNNAEARTVFALLAPDALTPPDPYGVGPETTASGTIAALLSLYPSLADDLVALAGTDRTRRAMAGDIVVSAVGLNGLLSKQALPTVASLVADRLEELPERLRPADNRYSTKDDVETRRAGRRLGWRGRAVALASRLDPRKAGFRVRLALLIAADGVAWVILDRAAYELAVMKVVLPSFGLAEALTVAALLVALHVLAVELASGRLPAGMVSSVAWPARLASAYIVVAGILAASLFPSRLPHVPLAGAVVLLLHIPLVAFDLVSKSDLRRAGYRVWRDRQRDFSVAGEASARAFSRGVAVRKVLEGPSHVRQATTEPVTRRRVPIVAPRDGYLMIDVAAIERLDSLLTLSEKSPLRTGSPAAELALLVMSGRDVVAGDTIAVLEVDEPEIADVVLRATDRAFSIVSIGSADRARGAATTLAALHAAQSGSDPRGADTTSRCLVLSLNRFVRSAAAELSDLTWPRGFLQSVLPFDPAAEVVDGFEAAWRAAAGPSDYRSDEPLRQHALRLARMRGTSEHASALDYLIARLGVVMAEATPKQVHASASLMSDLGGLAAELAGKDSFFPARMSLERLLDRLSRQNPIPPEERPVRQRFEELLARALVADYFLEVQVERGCQKLLEIAQRASSAPRRQDVLLGVAKIGALSLDYGRVALAASLAVRVRHASIDWAIVRALSANEDYGSRLSMLSTLAGGLFGADVPASVLRYADWAESICAAYP